MSESPLPPVVPPVPVPEGGKPARVKCEFCQCQLAPNGDVMAMSDTARTYRDQAERIQQLTSALTAAQKETQDVSALLDQARAALAAATPAVVESSRKGW